MNKYLLIVDTQALGIVPALYRLTAAGYRVLLIERETGNSPLRELLDGQEIAFETVARSQVIAKVIERVDLQGFDRGRSAVVGDPALAGALGLKNFEGAQWREIATALLDAPRMGKASRITKETRVEVEVTLEGTGKAQVTTGIEFFDHMLDQIARHAGIDLRLTCEGDLGVDEHHTIEDTAMVLGSALRKALGDKHGIARYGFWIPMDEAASKVTLDLSDRPYLVFKGEFPRERVGEFPTEMVPHFYRSLSQALGANIHVEVVGSNAHHMVESTFKAFARAFRMAITMTGKDELASTKGAL